MTERKKDPYARWKSAWLVTINSNKTDPKYAAPLRVIWRFISTHIAEFMWSPLPGVRLIQVRQRSEVEKGPKKGWIHLHAQIEVTSFGLAHLNYSKILAFVDRQLSQIPGFMGAHFRAIRVLNYNATSTIEEYLSKAPLNESEESTFKII